MRLALPILLLCAALGAGEAAPAETQVQQIVRTLPPRAATLKLIEVIRAQREDLAVSSEALVQLVQCYQNMRDLPGVAQEYAEVMPKYLGKPPPLDGTSLPTFTEAGDDLLWRSWTAKSADRYVLRLQSVKREKERDAAGKLTRQIQMRFDLVDLDATADRPEGRWGFSQDIREPQALEQHGRTAAEARHGTEVFTGAWNIHGTTVWTSFQDIPDEVTQLDLQMDMHLSRPSAIRRIEVPLRDGETWQVGEALGTLSAVVGGPTVNQHLLKAVGMAVKPSDEVSFTVRGQAEALPSHEFITLLANDGTVINTSGFSCHGSGDEMGMSFSGLDKPPVRLRFDVIGSRSEHTLPVRLTGIKLP